MWKDFLPPPFSGKYQNPFFHRFEISMVITLVVSAVAVAAAYPIAYFLAFVPRKSRYTLLMLVLAPFFTSYLLRVIAWKVMLANSGVINYALWELHLRPHGDWHPLADLLQVLGGAGAVLLVGAVRSGADLRALGEPRQAICWRRRRIWVPAGSPPSGRSRSR